LGDDEIAATREALGWQHAPFIIPEEVYGGWDAKQAGASKQAAWLDLVEGYKSEFPELASELERRLSGDLPADFEALSQAYVEKCQAEGATIATRKASQNAIEAFAAGVPELLGGSADLAGSNLTLWSGSKGVDSEDASGNYIYYGVREFGMSAIMNGIALHGGFIPYGATFLIFMEYARNAVRMAALMKQQSIFVYTHDSIGLGEDGPTHQPVEQLASLRGTPNMVTWRPCDAVESAVAWQQAIMRQDGPSALVFSRQNLPHQDRDASTLASVQRGGYILRDCEGTPELIFIATGSEVALAQAAAAEFADQGRAVRVVSMPSPEQFEAQDAEYRESVLPSDVFARVAVEALHQDYWYKYVGLDGRIIGMNSFGESAPANALFEHFDITVAAVLAAAEELLEA
jgi:transketolase